MKIRDERVEQTKNKIYAELMQLVYLLVAISFLAKSLYFKMELPQCVTEFVILILAPIYQMVRTRQLGVVLVGNLRQEMTLKKNTLVTIVILAMFLLFQLISGKEITVSFLLKDVAVFLVIFFVVRGIVVHMEGRRVEKLAKKYEDD